MIVEGPKTLEDFLKVRDTLKELLSSSYLDSSARKKIILKSITVKQKIEALLEAQKIVFRKRAEIDIYKLKNKVYRESSKKEFVYSFLKELPMESILKLINFKEEEEYTCDYGHNMNNPKASSNTRKKVVYSAHITLDIPEIK